MVSRLDALKAGFMFLAYIHRNKYKVDLRSHQNFNEEDFNAIPNELSKLFVNPAMPIENIEKRILYEKFSVGNDAIRTGLHGMSEAVIAWFNIGKITMNVLPPPLEKNEHILNVYRSKLGEVGLDQITIEKLVSLIKLHHEVIASGSGDSRPFMEVQQILYACAEKADFEANRPKIDMEIVIGDKFENISHSTIVNRSIVTKAFNKVKNNFDEETANALIRIAEEIQKSGNKDAAENFNSFSEELQKQEPKKPVLRSLWNGVTAALPSILQMTEVVTKIEKLFPA